MNQLQVGFSRINIDPHLGIGVFGYYKPRFATGYLDELKASAVCLAMGDKRILLLSVDTCEIKEEPDRRFRTAVSEATGIPFENIFLHSIHTHTGPWIEHNDMFECDDTPNFEYQTELCKRLVDVSILAAQDLKPAKMGFIVGQAPDRVAYIRRYKMKDGRTCTCPPINDPLIDHALGELDQRVNVLRFDREGGDTIVFMNYGIHSDTLNTSELSPDFCGVMRDTFERCVPGTKMVFFCGCQGDVGSTHVWPAPGDMNDTEISFDNEMKSPGMCRFVGRALCGSVLQVYDKVEYVDVDDIEILHNFIDVPSNMPTEKDDMEKAHLYNKLHEEGRDEEIPFEAMELTTVVAEVRRLCMLEHGPESFRMDLTGVKIGPVALVGIPGEPFTQIGVEIKKTEGWKCILPVCLTNGAQEYFPTTEAYAEGGYEARECMFKAGVAERIVDGSRELLNRLNKS